MTRDMILMFAVDENWSIGLDGDMHVHLREDLKRFKSFTEGNIIIMGRKTLESLPNKKPLPERMNIVLTRNKFYEEDGFKVVNDLDELFDFLKDNRLDRKVFVTGGQTIVDQLIGYCDKAYITKIKKAFPKSDTSIENLDKNSDWVLEEESETISQGDLDYSYCLYRRK